MILLIAISGLTVMARYYGQIPLKMQLYTNNMLDLTVVTRITIQRQGRLYSRTLPK